MTQEEKEMKFMDLHDLCKSVCECHEEKDNSITIIVNDYEFMDFMSVLRKYKGLFENHIDCFIGDGYIAIPNFDDYLSMMDIDIIDWRNIYGTLDCKRFE